MLRIFRPAIYIFHVSFLPEKRHSDIAVQHEFIDVDIEFFSGESFDEIACATAFFHMHCRYLRCIEACIFDYIALLANSLQSLTEAAI